MKQQSIQKRFYSEVVNALLEVPCEPPLVLLFPFWGVGGGGGGGGGGTVWWWVLNAYMGGLGNIKQI